MVGKECGGAPFDRPFGGPFDRSFDRLRAARRDRSRTGPCGMDCKSKP